MKRILKLNKELYTSSSIDRAIIDYSGLAKIKAAEDYMYYYISFHRCKYDVEKTVSEFCNYLIDLQNCKE